MSIFDKLKLIGNIGSLFQFAPRFKRLEIVDDNDNIKITLGSTDGLFSDNPGGVIVCTDSKVGEAIRMEGYDDYGGESPSEIVANFQYLGMAGRYIYGMETNMLLRNHGREEL